MSRRRTPTFTALDDQLISSGLQLDRHSIKRLLWESAENCVFWNGTVRRKVPPALAYDTGSGEPIRGIGQQYASDGGRWLWAATSDDIYRWEFAAPSLVGHVGTYITDATASQRPSLYDFTPYGDWMIVYHCFPGEPAKIWKPSTFATYAPGEAPVGVTTFLKMMSFMMALGYGPRGTQVGWSDANDIEEWTSSPSNSAGSLTIDEFNTPIRAGCKLADAIAVYSEDQMALVRYISAPFYFGQKTTLDGIGAIGKQAVASDGKVNVGFGRAGAWWTDGVSQRYIDEGYLANYFQDNINWAQAAKIKVSRNDETGTFEFDFPMRTSLALNEGWSWDPRTGGWSPRPSVSCADERRLFDHIIYGTNDGKVMLGDYDYTADAPLSLETKPLVMQTAESPHVVTRVDEVDFLLHQAQAIEFRVGSCDEPNGDWEWTEWNAVEAGAKIKQIDELPEQPYWKLALRSTPGVNDWRLDLQGFLLYGVTTGTKT
jgi:hypothetical protein